jgi:rhamnose transport system permease protein
VVTVSLTQMALVQLNVSSDKQNIVTGVLLLISVIVPNGGEALRRAREYLRRRARSQPG